MQATAQDAFRFCAEYKRPNEFRRLCDQLRLHLAGLSRWVGATLNVINVTVPESLQMHIETRFVQMNVALELQLWQEAYKTAEDIHGVIVLAKKMPKVSSMAKFYAKLANLFWLGENYLFHAVASCKLFTLRTWLGSLRKSHASTFCHPCLSRSCL